MDLTEKREPEMDFFAAVTVTVTRCRAEILKFNTRSEKKREVYQIVEQENRTTMADKLILIDSFSLLIVESILEMKCYYLLLNKILAMGFQFFRNYV